MKMKKLLEEEKFYYAERPDSFEEGAKYVVFYNQYEPNIFIKVTNKEELSAALNHRGINDELIGVFKCEKLITQNS